MGGREYAAIAGDTQTTFSIADVVSVVDEGALALPVFADTGGPFPGREGQIVSQSTLTAAQTQALASIYCALVSDVSLTLCNSAGDIIVEGAFAKNNILLQCLSVFRSDQNVFASADSTGTTMGAAMLAIDGKNDRVGIPAPDLTQATMTDPVLRKKLLEYRSLWHAKVRQRRQDL